MPVSELPMRFWSVVSETTARRWERDTIEPRPKGFPIDDYEVEDHWRDA